MSDSVMDLMQQFRKEITTKPCRQLGYCPYGPLVEEFPHLNKGDIWKCKVFGHMCPVTLVAEPFVDEEMPDANNARS
jgi:hypothetical protein